MCNVGRAVATEDGDIKQGLLMFYTVLLMLLQTCKVLTLTLGVEWYRRTYWKVASGRCIKEDNSALLRVLEELNPPPSSAISSSEQSSMQKDIVFHPSQRAQ